MSCGYNKPECGCGQKTSAACVIYEGSRGTCSSDTTSNSLANELASIYDKICKLNAHTDTVGIRLSCDGAGEDKSVRDSLLQISDMLCSLSTRVSNSEQILSSCGLYYGELLEDCKDKSEPETLCEFFQFILDKLMYFTEKLK